MVALDITHIWAAFRWNTLKHL